MIKDFQIGMRTSKKNSKKENITLALRLYILLETDYISSMMHVSNS